MAVINKTASASSLPISFKRGNPIPLDNSAVWYNFEELVAYAKTGATAYVGQILAYVNETDKTSKAYIIVNEAGDLQEVGAATLGDNKTIVLKEGTLALKNWGVEYYKWVEAVGTEGQEGYVAGHHEKQIVDGEHPWIAGLEPKALKDTDGNFILAWYQPSTTTVEGLSSSITTINNTINTINQTLGDKQTENTVLGDVEKLKAEVEKKLDKAGGTMTGDLTLKDGGKAISDTAVQNLIASAGHLKREIVEQLPAVAEADKDTIYMVKDTSVLGGDKYKEYMLVGEELAQIGDTSVDLTDYMKKAVPAKEGNVPTLDADGNIVDGGKTVEEIKTEIVNAAITQADLSKYVEKEEGKGLLATTEATRLAGMATIKTVGTGLNLDANGELTATYELPIATDTVLGGVKQGNGVAIATDGVLSAKVATGAANGLSVTAEGIALALATKTTAGAMSTAQVTKLENLVEGAQVNIVEGALLGETVAEINDSKQIVIPVATADKLGLVKSSTGYNAVGIAEDGVMNVAKVSTTTLEVPEGDVLILDGGAAQG